MDGFVSLNPIAQIMFVLYRIVFVCFSSSPGNGIHLQFLSFDLEEQSSCLFDYVQIREGKILYTSQ